MVDDIISKAVNQEQKFNEVLERIVQHIQDNLSPKEKHFIKTEYVKCALDQFWINVQTQIDQVLPVSSIRQWLENRCFLKEMITFRKVKGYLIIQHCIDEDMFTNKEEKKLLSELTTLCKLHIQKHTSPLQNMCSQFIIQFDLYLKRLYQSPLGGGGEVELHEDIFEKAGIVSWLKATEAMNSDIRFPDVSRLIDALTKAGETSTARGQLQEQIKKCFELYERNPTLKKEMVDGKTRFVFQGGYANTKEILLLLSHPKNDSEDVDEFRILVSKLLVINSDIKGYPGMNLVIIAKSIYVASENTEQFVIDVSGRHGTTIEPSKAKDGQIAGMYY